jgi:hypothetical protein
VRRWWWPSGTITPTVSALNEGEMMRGRGSGKGGVRFREERGRRGGGHAWRHAAARARVGGGGLLGEGEGDGARVSRAIQEAEVHEEGGWLGHPGRLGRKGGTSQFGSSAKTKK